MYGHPHGRALAGNLLNMSGSGGYTWTSHTAKVGTVSGMTHIANMQIKARTSFIFIRLERMGGGSPSLAAASLDWECPTTTDAQGSYWFYDVPIGSYTLTATKEGHEPQSTTISMTAADVARGGVSVDMTVIKIDNTLLCRHRRGRGGHSGAPARRAQNEE